MTDTTGEAPATAGASQRRWTPELLAQMEEMAQTMTYAEIAEKIGSTRDNVAMTFHRKGLKRPDKAAKLSSIAAQVRAEMYPSGGPWKCARCGVAQPTENFYQEPNGPENHTCRRCQRDYRLRHYYGISLAEYDEMLADQSGVCAICEKEEIHIAPGGEIAPLSVDHDHSCCAGRKSCGKCVRGLLCTRCNNAIERIETGVDPMRIVDYLTRHRT